MKSKKLGRSELLTWVNKTVESDYIKIEDLSDGVGFCQIIDAFFKNISKEMNSLKLNAINEIELKQKNLYLLNTLLGKAGCIKHIDPNKLSKGLFSTNLEFLQFLPSHLITNEVMLKIEKDKFFNESESDSDYTNEDELQIYEENNELQNKLDKYKLFFKLLEDDLIGYVDENKKLNEEMHDIEEEKDYFLGKLQNINIFCENQNNKSQNIKTKEHCTNIINIITNVPHDFQ